MMMTTEQSGAREWAPYPARPEWLSGPMEGADRKVALGLLPMLIARHREDIASGARAGVPSARTWSTGHAINALIVDAHLDLPMGHYATAADAARRAANVLWTRGEL